MKRWSSPLASGFVLALRVRASVPHQKKACFMFCKCILQVFPSCTLAALAEL